MLFRKKAIYADAAAATPLSPMVQAELVRLLGLYSNPGALHQGGVSARNELDTARAHVATTIGAHADEVVFVASGTEANNLAIQGTLRPLLKKYGELHAVTSAIEHQSVLEPLMSLEDEGLYLTILPVDSDGRVSSEALKEAITDETVFVSIQMVNSEVGVIEPIRDLAKEVRHKRLARTAEVPLYFHVDASQSPLWLPLAVEKLGVDMLTLDGQKILGPKGIGVLYVRRGTELEAIIHGGGQERGLRGGTENLPLIGAFAVALAEAQKGVGARVKAVADVRDFLWQTIHKYIPEAILNGPAVSGPARVANNLHISIPNLDGEMAIIALAAEGIAASTRSACSVGDEEPSHVMRAIGVPEKLLKTGIRITLLPDVTKKDALRIAHTLVEIAKRYRVGI